jgi:hypothetical protein
MGRKERFVGRDEGSVCPSWSSRMSDISQRKFKVRSIRIANRRIFCVQASD